MKRTGIKDPRIKLDDAQQKMVAEIICTEIKESMGENEHLYKLARRCENQYNQVTKYMEQGKRVDFPWEDASDYFIPLTEWIVDAIYARTLNILFSSTTEPYMTAIGTEGSDVDKADGVTDFVDMVLREIVDVYESTKFFFKQMIKLPFAVLKYDWQSESEPMIVKDKAQKFISPDGKEEYLLPDDEDQMGKAMEYIANGYQPAGEEEVWAVEDIDLINAPQAKYIRFEDYIWSPNAKKGVKLYWEGDRFYSTVYEMRQREVQEKYIEGSAKKVEACLKLEDKSGKDKALATRSAKVECFNWYGRLPFNSRNEVDFEDGEAIEQEVHCVVAYKEKVLLQTIIWPYGRRPNPDRVYMRGVFDETENFEGRSLVQKLYMTQKELNTLHNNIMNNAMLAMQKIFVKRKSAAGDEWDRPELYPGAIWEEDMPGDIRVLSVGDVSRIGQEIEGGLLDFAARISNIDIYQTGAARTEGGQKTKAEVILTIEEGNIGMGKFINNCHKILQKICKWTVAYYYENMPPGLERRIRGAGGELIFPNAQTEGLYQERGINTHWSEDDIAGQFDFSWNGTALSANRKFKIAVANDMMEQFLPQPMVQGSLIATWEILKRGLQARGVDDWQKILPPKEAIMAEMEQMKAQADTDRVARAKSGRMPEMVMQKLIEKGMEPEEAQKAAFGGGI